jgi:hypothetical protein
MDLSNWNDRDVATDYMNWLSKQLDIKDMEDWYKIRKEDIIDRCGLPLLKKYGTLVAIMRTFYPGIVINSIHDMLV